MAQATPQQYLRYRLSHSSSANPALDAGPYKRQVHALFAQWVKSHCHLRDFEAALAHVCAVQSASYLMSGALLSPGQVEPAPAIHYVPLEPARPLSPHERHGPRHRFYDDEGNISLAVPLRTLEPPLNELYLVWLAKGWHPRDFEVFIGDLAAEVVYDLETVTALQGLGGCRSPEDYLNTPLES